MFGEIILNSKRQNENNILSYNKYNSINKVILIYKTEQKKYKNKEKIYNSPKSPSINSNLYKRKHIHSKTNDKSSTNYKTDSSKPIKPKNNFKNEISSITNFTNNLTSAKNKKNKSRNIYDNNFPLKNKSIKLSKYSNKISPISLLNGTISNNNAFNKENTVTKIRLNKTSVKNEKLTKQISNKSNSNLKKYQFSNCTKKIKNNLFNKKNIFHRSINYNLIKAEKISIELNDIKKQINNKFKNNKAKSKRKKDVENNYKIQDFSFNKNCKLKIQSQKCKTKTKYFLNDKLINNNLLKIILEKVKTIKMKTSNISILTSNLVNLLSENETNKDNMDYETPHFSANVEK